MDSHAVPRLVSEGNSECWSEQPKTASPVLLNSFPLQNRATTCKPTGNGPRLVLAPDQCPGDG